MDVFDKKLSTKDKVRESRSTSRKKNMSDFHEVLKKHIGMTFDSKTQTLSPARLRSIVLRWIQQIELRQDGVIDYQEFYNFI